LHGHNVEVSKRTTVRIYNNDMKLLPKHSRIALAVLAVSSFHQAHAQRTDAGRVFDSVIQRETTVVKPKAPSVNLKQAPNTSSVMPSAGTQLEVKEFRIEGAKLLAQPKLESAVKPFAGRTLSIAQLQEAADAVTQAYRDAGYVLVQAAVLPQTIQNGVVIITVNEGRLEKLNSSVAGDNGRALPSVIQTGLASNIRVGEPVNTTTLEESLLLVNDLPGSGRASAELVPGSKGNETDLTVNYTPAARASGIVLLDNAGNRFTGRERLLGQLNINEPFGAGDQLSITALTTGSLLSYLQAGYRIPTSLRTSLGLSVSKLNYELCCQPAGTQAEGDVSAITFDATHKLIVQRNKQIVLSASYDLKQLRTEINSINTTDRQTQGISLGARGFWSDTAYNGWTATLRSGRADLSDNQADRASDAQFARVQGRYNKLNASYYRSQAITTAWSWVANVRGQANLGRNLESSEKFSLGGADGVRAFPSGEAVGDSGWLTSLELRYAWAAVPGLSLAGFVDAGGIRRFSKNVTIMQGALPNSYELAGTGLNMRYDSQTVSLQLTLANPIGDNKGKDANGNNNEGRRDGKRAWLSATWRF
jgi:hemolysin activation/secretion protein